MTRNLTHGFDIVEEIAEPIVNTLVGVTEFLPTDLMLPFDGEVRPGARVTGTVTFHLVRADMLPGTVRLDAFIDDGVILDVAFYNTIIELNAPNHCSIGNLVGRIYITGVIDVITPDAHPNHRYLAIHTFLPCTVIPEGGSHDHIGDALRECDVTGFSATELVHFIGRTIDEYLVAIISRDGYLQLHEHPIVIHPGSTDPFQPQEIDVSVVNEVLPEPGLERDALALLVTTLGEGGDPTAFGSTSFLRTGEDSAATISNFSFLRYIVRPLIIAAIGMPADEVDRHFDPGHPCRLSVPWEQTSYSFADLGIRTFDGEVAFAVDVLEVNADDGGFFSVQIESSADICFQIGRRLGRIGGARGTLNGSLFFDLIGHVIEPRPELTPNVEAEVDRGVERGIMIMLFLLSPHLIPAFRALAERLERLVEERITNLINAVLTALEDSMPSIDVRILFEWLGPYGFEFAPDAVIVDDIGIYGALVRDHPITPAGREGYGIVLPTEWAFDLDRGEMRETGTTDPHVIPDFEWDRAGEKRCIVAANGASVAYLGRRASFAELSRNDLTRLHYTEDSSIFEAMLPIVADNQPLDTQTGGVVFAMMTSNYRYAKVRVYPMYQSSTDLTFDFVTYD